MLIAYVGSGYHIGHHNSVRSGTDNLFIVKNFKR